MDTATPGFSAHDLELLRRELPPHSTLAPVQPGAQEITLQVSVDTITLIARADGVDWRWERDPVVEPGRDAGHEPDLLRALRVALSCA